MFRFAICNELYRDWPFDRAFAHARNCGYEGVEIAPHTLGEGQLKFAESNINEVRRAAESHGLTVVGLHWLLAQTKDLHWTSDDATVRANTAAYFKRLIDLCAMLQGSLLVLGSPKQRSLPQDMSLQRGLDNAAFVIEMLLPRLAEHRITLAVEPLGPDETNFLNTADQVRDFVRMFESPWLRLQLDVKAMCTEPNPIPSIIAAHRDLLTHFHANDPNRRGPGMGDRDFVPILRSLIEAEYRGWISVEVFDETPGIDALAGESIRNLRRDYCKAIAL